MTRTERRLRGALPLALIVLALAACSGTVSPTEPSNPAASMSGTVRSNESLVADLKLECQGKETGLSPDGAYALDGLEAGPTTVRVTHTYDTSQGVLTDSANFYVVLGPGKNPKDFFVSW